MWYKNARCKERDKCNKKCDFKDYHECKCIEWKCFQIQKYVKCEVNKYPFIKEKSE